MTNSLTNTSARGFLLAHIACTGARVARVALSLTEPRARRENRASSLLELGGAVMAPPFSPLSGGPSTRAYDCTGFARAERLNRRMGLLSAAVPAVRRRKDGKGQAPKCPSAALTLILGSRPKPDRGSSGDRRGETRTSPHSARCCHIRARPSRADGGCYPEGCSGDSMAPSAAQQSTFNHREQVRRSGWLQHSLPIPTASRST